MFNRFSKKREFYGDRRSLEGLYPFTYSLTDYLTFVLLLRYTYFLFYLRLSISFILLYPLGDGYIRADGLSVGGALDVREKQEKPQAQRQGQR